MGKKYYCNEEIKEKFKSYKDLERSDITDEEYGVFCEAIEIIRSLIYKINL